MYELAPLRRIDVFNEAGTSISDQAKFMAEVEERNAVPMAIRPVTLAFLVNSYSRSRFPANRQELYFEGCRVLCEEPDSAKRESAMLGRPDVIQRLNAATRLAAIMIFCRRSAIWSGADLGDRPESDLLVSDFTSIEPSTFTADGIHDTLTTNLFFRIDGNRHIFSHQTYAEFLAAKFVTQNKLGVEQISSLICHAGDPDGRVVPQLSETAAWIAAMNPLIFEKLLRRDPQVLLRSDVATASTDDKRRLVRSLLAAFEAGDVYDDISLREHYRKLNYATIAEDLRPYIVDKSKGVVVRRAAIDIAEECIDAAPLQKILADLALDTTEDFQVREQAAQATSVLADDETKERLKQLILSSGPKDANDQLKGIALRALWPRVVSGSDLFAALTLPQNDSYYGAYEAFIVSDLTPKLESENLVEALRWSCNLPRRHDLPLSFIKLMDRAFELAFERLADPNILPACRWRLPRSVTAAADR
jgi:hypothetical protein